MKYKTGQMMMDKWEETLASWWALGFVSSTLVALLSVKVPFHVIIFFTTVAVWQLVEPHSNRLHLPQYQLSAGNDFTVYLASVFRMLRPLVTIDREKTSYVASHLSLVHPRTLSSATLRRICQC
jgi:hypothetical protein